MVKHLGRFHISVYHAPGQAVDDLTPVLATWDIHSTIRQEIVEKKCITTYSLGRWQRKRTDIPGSQHKYPLAI